MTPSALRRRTLLLSGMLTLLSALDASAKQAPGAAPLPLAQVPAGTDTYTHAQRRLADGTVAALYEVHAPVTPGTPEAMAREFLRGWTGTLGLKDAALADLEHFHTRTGPAGTNVHFLQRVAGLPVHGARIVVHVSPGDVVTHVTSSYRPQAQLAGAVPLVSAEQALTLVASAVGARTPYGVHKAELVAFPLTAGTTLAWQVLLVPAFPAGDWEGIVDARSGALLALHDRAPRATGSVFDPDPLSSARKAYGAPGFSDANDAESPEMAAQRVTVTLDEVEPSNGKYPLRTRWAEITDHEGPRNGLYQQESPDFSFTREQDGFEAVHTFWHIQDTMRYIAEQLGLSVHAYQYPGGVQFDPHGLDGDDNSHYSPSSGQLAFGEGCVDDAEDADVVRHELAHGLHDWVTVGGLSNNVDGLSEGIADYWAQSYSRSLGQWQPTDAEYEWVFSWDGHNECWAGRVTNYELPWPAGIQPYPFIHTSGQIVSTCLMKVWNQIGREKTDRMLLEGLAMTGALSSQNDAANAMLQAATDMNYPAADVAAISDTFGSCGYLIGVAVPTLAPGPGAGNAPPASGAQKSGSGVGAVSWSDLLVLLLGALLAASMRAASRRYSGRTAAISAGSAAPVRAAIRARARRNRGA